MAIQKETLKKTEQSYKNDLDSIRRELKVACKSAQELECNNSELKEEVSLYSFFRGVDIKQDFVSFNRCYSK